MPIKISALISMPNNADHCRSMPINTDQFLSIPINAGSRIIDRHWYQLILIGIDQHCLFSAAATCNESTVFTNVLLMPWSDIDRHWSKSIEIDRQWLALRGISDQCHNFDWHWSALGIDCESLVYRHRRIKMQSADLHFKTPPLNILKMNFCGRFVSECNTNGTRWLLHFAG